MSEYERILEELDFAIENGCDYQFLERLKVYIRKIRSENCHWCGRFVNAHLGLCKGCKYERE